MKLALSLIIAFIVTCQANAQQAFQSYGYHLFVSPGEQMIITNKSGEIAIADSLGAYWRSVSETTKEPIIGAHTEQSNFFNRDTGFASGFIFNDSKYNIIYHTTDAGKTWRKVDFGSDGWVDAAVNLDNGEAWMSIGGKQMAYTKDYGFTWQTLPSPNTQQRFVYMFFNPKREGLVGSVWNTVAYTPDNCRHWTSIPTPLDQRKYNKTNKESRPEIYGVAIYKDYFLVNQEHLVFYSKRDTINWIPLPGYTSFITDATNSALFFITEKNTIVKANDQLEPVFKHPSNNLFYSAFCRNGNLFIMTSVDMLQLTSGNIVRVAALLSDKPQDMEPRYFGYNKTISYGAVDNIVYTKKGEDEDWEYAFTLPFIVGQQERLIYKNDTVVYQHSMDSIYYYHIKKKKTDIANMAGMLKDFEEKNISTIRFTKGSQGCFHNFAEEVVYRREGETYVKIKGNTLNTKANTINASLVQKFVQHICGQYEKKVTIDEMGFTEQDYQKCKKDIRAYQVAAPNSHRLIEDGEFAFNQNNVDFDRLVSLVDSIRHIDPSLLNSTMMNSTEGFSTTTDWVKIIVTNSQGSKIEISNSYSFSNAMYFPWKISINGAYSISLSADITQFVRQVCPSLLTDENKVPILHSLVKKLYTQQ